MATISDFKAQLAGGGARPNQFRVIMPFPTFAIAGNESEKMVFLCKAAQLPSSILGSIEVPFRGRFIKLAGERTFETWNITILNDTDFLLRNAFERWSNSISAHSANIGIDNPNEYGVDAQVQQMGRSDTVLKEYTMYGIYPINVSPIELSMDTNDTIEEFTVELSVQYWMSNTTT